MQTCQNPGTSTNRSRNYELVHMVWKQLMIKMHANRELSPGIIDMQIVINDSNIANEKTITYKCNNVTYIELVNSSCWWSDSEDLRHWYESNPSMFDSLSLWQSLCLVFSWLCNHDFFFCGMHSMVLCIAMYDTFKNVIYMLITLAIRNITEIETKIGKQTNKNILKWIKTKLKDNIKHCKYR